MKCEVLKDFSLELDFMQYDQEPNYNKLRFLLIKEMLNVG